MVTAEAAEKVAEVLGVATVPAAEVGAETGTAKVAGRGARAVPYAAWVPTWIAGWSS